MRRFWIIVAGLAALAACGAATHWMLARPRLNPRMNYALCPPHDIGYPGWFERFRGYASGGETGMTMIAWMKYSTTYAQQIVPPFVMASCTAEAARATRDGGAALTNLVTGALDDGTEIDVSGGSWTLQCLPAGYAVPDTLADSQWQYGCYCINVTTDTPLTLSVADTEIFIPVTSNMVRNVQGSSASRYVIITPERANARVRFGIAENPLHQFIGAQSDSMSPYGGSLGGATEYGGLDETWRMFAFRARIDNGKMIVRMDGYTPGTHLAKVQCVTQNLFRVRSTFEKDAMFRVNCCGFAVESLTIGGSMAKMLDGWIADAQLERIRDLDVQELERHGASFPELAEDYRLLRVTKSSASTSTNSVETLVTNAQTCAVASTVRTTLSSATAEVIHGVNYAGNFSPADYIYSCPGATVEGNTITFPSSGDYTIRATDPMGGFLTNLVTASAGTQYTTQEIEYTQDGGPAAAFNGAVAGALASATNDGVQYAYISGTVTNKYYKWKARRLWPVPSACAVPQGHYAKHAISPHVVASALHYWYWPQSAMTFTDAQGNTATVTPGGAIRADQWARSHGFSEAEITAADLGDLVLFVVDGAIPDGCCPYLMSADTWRSVMPGPPFGVLGWRATQTDLGWGLPVLFNSDIGNPGSGRASKWTWSRSFPYPTKAYSWTGASGLMAANHNYGIFASGTFAPTYGGDSGHPLYLEDGSGNLILISQHHTVSSGTCFPRAFEIIRAFCAAQGDTIKEWTVQ